MRAPAVIYKAERDDNRIKSNKYVTFARPYRGKQGLLIIGKQQRPLLIDESEPDNPRILPMRLDREAILGTWIFAISIYHAEGLIQLEDCIAADGDQFRSTKVFKERFAVLQRFTESIWYQDQQFQLNWQMKVADIYPLIDIKTTLESVNGGCLCMMPDIPSFRLLKVLPLAPVKAEVVGGPQDYICVGVIGKPDVYDIKKADGTDMGRACIQTLSISQALQQKRVTGETIRVMAEWNEDFESYVVTTVL